MNKYLHFKTENELLKNELWFLFEAFNFSFNVKLSAYNSVLFLNFNKFNP